MAHINFFSKWHIFIEKGFKGNKTVYTYVFARTYLVVCKLTMAYLLSMN